MRLNVQRARSGRTLELILTSTRWGTRFTQPIVAHPTASVIGLTALVALAEIRVDVPQPVPNPTLISAKASAPEEEEEEGKPLKELSWKS